MRAVPAQPPRPVREDAANLASTATSQAACPAAMLFREQGTTGARRHGLVVVFRLFQEMNCTETTTTYRDAQSIAVAPRGFDSR